MTLFFPCKMHLRLLSNQAKVDPHVITMPQGLEKRNPTNINSLSKLELKMIF